MPPVRAASGTRAANRAAKSVGGKGNLGECFVLAAFLLAQWLTEVDYEWITQGSPCSGLQMLCNALGVGGLPREIAS